MTTPGRRSQSVTGRLRAIAGRFRRRRDDAPRSRVHVASFEHTHRVWNPDPPRSFFERQGMEKWKG